MNTDYTPVHVIGSGLAGYEAEAKAKEEAVRLQLYGRTEAAVSYTHLRAHET